LFGLTVTDLVGLFGGSGLEEPRLPRDDITTELSARVTLDPVPLNVWTALGQPGFPAITSLSTGLIFS
jgi:hypothetical protein